MRCFKFLLFPLILSGNILAQGNLPIALKLDEKNGFKDFQIGDGYSKWQKELKFLNKKNDLSFYTYTGNCCPTIFSVDVEFINLGFKDGKLAVIYLETKTVRVPSKTKWESDDYEVIKRNFDLLFEVVSPNFPTDDNSGRTISQWIGKKLFLTLTYHYQGIKKLGDSVDGSGNCSVMLGLLPDTIKDF
ncbi:hypothetical protein [Aquiflexum sp.]|uniref:hypothetical protein n=1 Tax=Aquiflexum sp. TaxID=1872584 RepID=UPI003592F730